jgi:hypothetical protein
MTEKKPMKTPEERQAINEAVTQEERLRVVRERMSPQNTSRKPISIAVGFTKGTEVHKLVEEMSFYFGSPISAELDENNQVIFQTAKETGLTRWRADESTPEEASDTVKAVALAVLTSEDPSFIAQVNRAIATSKHVSMDAKSKSRRFFGNLEKYRSATSHIRKQERINGARKGLKGLTKEEVLRLVNEEFGHETEQLPAPTIA